MCKNIDEVMTEMQKNLLFPLDKDEPFICGAATIVYNQFENILKVYVPTHPLYYGYKVYVEITHNNMYCLVFNPVIEKLFRSDLNVLGEISFIHLPFTLSEEYLLDSIQNKSLYDWLLDSS